MNLKPEFTVAEINRLQAAYQETTYEVYYNQKTIKLHIGKVNSQLDRLLQKHNCTKWALITAFNPYSQCLSPTENQHRHQQLIEHLQPMQLIAFNALGKDEIGTWTPEKSLLILGIDRFRAIAIGLKFEQNAIVCGELNQPPELQWL